MGNGSVATEDAIIVREADDQAGYDRARFPETQYVETPYLKGLADRALAYLKAGLPINLSGPAGIGKSTLALHLAALLDRPTVVMHGDDELGTSGLVGGNTGYKRFRLFDNYIHSVRKTEEKVSSLWVDNRLTMACKQGMTLIYDEFTRSRAEANNVLLSVLEERVLDLPGAEGEDAVLAVHPEFRAIFTSNPEEYAGIHRAQDALLDRMVTISMDRLDLETDIAITRAKSGVDQADAEKIVAVVTAFKDMFPESKGHHILRACIMIGKTLRRSEARAAAADKVFLGACSDILCNNGLDREKGAKGLSELVAKHCP